MPRPIDDQMRRQRLLQQPTSTYSAMPRPTPKARSTVTAPRPGSRGMMDTATPNYQARPSASPSMAPVKAPPTQRVSGYNMQTRAPHMQWQGGAANTASQADAGQRHYQPGTEWHSNTPYRAPLPTAVPATPTAQTGSFGWQDPAAATPAPAPQQQIPQDAYLNYGPSIWGTTGEPPWDMAALRAAQQRAAQQQQQQPLTGTTVRGLAPQQPTQPPAQSSLYGQTVRGAERHDTRPGKEDIPDHSERDGDRDRAGRWRAVLIAQGYEVDDAGNYYDRDGNKAGNIYEDIAGAQEQSDLYGTTGSTDYGAGYGPNGWYDPVRHTVPADPNVDRMPGQDAGRVLPESLRGEPVVEAVRNPANTAPAGGTVDEFERRFGIGAPPQLDMGAVNALNEQTRRRYTSEQGRLIQAMAEGGARVGAGADQMMGATGDVGSRMGIASASEQAQTTLRAAIANLESQKEYYARRWAAAMAFYADAQSDEAREDAQKHALEAIALGAQVSQQLEQLRHDLENEITGKDVAGGFLGALMTYGTGFGGDQSSGGFSYPY